ncbi:MAG TPA: hypothetical protein VK590_08735 [Saprospiraceae bacterium]|nr:hypothetical protein [Saprospiraceae bacterium]
MNCNKCQNELPPELLICSNCGNLNEEKRSLVIAKDNKDYKIYDQLYFVIIIIIFIGYGITRFLELSKYL